MLTIKATPTRGLVRVSGDVPNGTAVIQRKSDGVVPFTLRNGNLTILTGGFSLEDSEPPIGVPVTYTAISTPTNRLIQRNLAWTPDFTHGVQSWTAGASRTIGITSSGNPAGAGSAIVGTVSSSSSGTVRTIAEFGVEPLTGGQRYLLIGKVRFRTPGVWTWQDVKNFGTWQSVKTAKTDWAAVRSSISVPSGDSYATLWVSLSLGGTDYMAPVQVFQNSMSSTNQWMIFSAWVYPPIGTPANARIRLLHGNTTREYSIAWDFDQISVYSEADAGNPFRMFWFSGDSAVPAKPQNALMRDTIWDDVSFDSSITWEGAVGNSASRFTGPSVISTSATITLDPPGGVPCEPILLSDPVSSALSQWFGLAAIGDLSREARITIMSVLGRSDFVSTSSARSTPKAELTLYTNTLEDRLNTLRLFQSGRVLLLRNPNPAYPETSWYISCGDVTEHRTFEKDARRPERTWTVPFVQVERPTGLIEASNGVTWQQIKDKGLTWAQLRNQRESWLDVALVDP